MYNSLMEICQEFNIDYTDDIEIIKKKLTEIQKNTHPDSEPNNRKEVDDLYYRVTEAKEYIKKNYTQNQELVTVKELVDLIQVSNKKNELTTIIKENETHLENTYEKSLKQIKGSFLPKKIASGTIMGIATAIWGFPSILTQNPIINNYISSISESKFYFFLTSIWALVILLSIEFWVIVVKRERQFKSILYQFKDNKFQYEVFSAFAKNVITNNTIDKPTFSRSELENFILDKVLEKYKKNWKKNIINSIPNNINVYIDELLPKLSEIIINRAIEQNIIVKSDEATWEDKYIIIAPSGF